MFDPSSLPMSDAILARVLLCGADTFSQFGPVSVGCLPTSTYPRARCTRTAPYLVFVSRSQAAACRIPTCYRRGKGCPTASGFGYNGSSKMLESPLAMLVGVARHAQRRSSRGTGRVIFNSRRPIPVPPSQWLITSRLVHCRIYHRLY